MMDKVMDRQQQPITAIEFYSKRFQAIKTEHNKLVAAYKDLSDYINPTRGIFNGDRTKIGKMIDHQKLLSGHATHSLRIFASGMNSGMTSKSSLWFRCTFEDKDVLEEPGVKEWLDSLQNGMYSTINGSNLHGIFYSTYEELGQFGTACFLILEDFDDVIRGRSFTAGEYYLATNAKGQPNAFGRDYEMTVGQLVENYGLESCSPQVQGHYVNRQFDLKIKVSHLIQDNPNRNPNKLDNQNMAFESVYWETGNSGNQLLARRGYKSFRIVAPRWDVVTTDTVYGYGPGWHALGAIKEMQKTREDKLMAQEKLHNPPMQQDGSVEGHTNFLPGGLTKSSGNTPSSGVRPAYQINPALESFVQLLDEEKEEIDKFFFVNLFLMMLNGQNDPQKTATEVAELQQEKIMMMGPALHRLDEELLTKTLDLVYELMEDAGMIPIPPPAIRGLKIKIEFTSILAQAQKALGISKIERVLTMVTNPQILTAFPQVVDNIDIDECIREINDMEGAPAKIIISKELVMEARDARQKQQNQAIALQAASTGADAAQKLGNTPLNTNSALDKLMSQGAAQSR